MTFPKQNGEKPVFQSISGLTAPSKFDVGGIVVLRNESDSEAYTCVVTAVGVKNTKQGCVDITVIEHGKKDVFQPLKVALKSYGVHSTTPFKQGTKLCFFDANFASPLQFEVIEDVQKPNKEGMYSILATQKKDSRNLSNSDNYLEIQTFSLQGLMMNESSKLKKSNYAENYSRGYTKRGGDTLGSP